MTNPSPITLDRAKIEALREALEEGLMAYSETQPSEELRMQRMAAALSDASDALADLEALSRAAPSGSDMVPWQAPEEATRDGTPIDAIISYNAAPVTIRWGVIDAIAGWVDVTQGYWAIGEDTELLAWRPAAPPATQPQGADNGK